MNKIEVGDLVRYYGSTMRVESILMMADGSVIDIFLIPFGDNELIKLNAKDFAELELITKSIYNYIT